MRHSIMIQCLVGWLLMTVSSAWAQTYNPNFPPEPNAKFKLIVTCEPSEAANLTGGGWHMYDTQVYINTSA